MKQSRSNNKEKRSAASAHRFMALVCASLLISAVAATAIAKYTASGGPELPIERQNAASSEASRNFVTVDVGGKKIRVNALALQQGPLTKDEAQRIADALKDNKSTAGLVEVRHADGTVEMDLQGRFQDVVIAKKNDDGTLSTACVDNSEAASAFLRPTTTTNTSEKALRKALAQ